MKILDFGLKINNETPNEKLFSIAKNENIMLIYIQQTGHTSYYADKYYAQIIGKSRKNYIKIHIANNVDTRMILNYTANKCSKHDTQFALPSNRQLIPCKPPLLTNRQSI